MNWRKRWHRRRRKAAEREARQYAVGCCIHADGTREPIRNMSDVERLFGPLDVSKGIERFSERLRADIVDMLSRQPPTAQQAHDEMKEWVARNLSDYVSVTVEISKC